MNSTYCTQKHVNMNYVNYIYMLEISSKHNFGIEWLFRICTIATLTNLNNQSN